MTPMMAVKLEALEKPEVAPGKGQGFKIIYPCSKHMCVWGGDCSHTKEQLFPLTDALRHM